MMYNEKLVVVVSCNGKIMREYNGKVFLPFGSEYSIKIKNLNSVKACVQVEVDGEDVLDGNSLVIQPNTTTTLDGFLKCKTAVNKFKFIKKTKEISNYRGDRIEDGLIKVTYKFERPPVFGRILSNSNTIYQTGTGNDCFYGSLPKASYCCDDGITVKGSRIHQEFDYATIGNLENTEHVIVLQLKGVKKSKKISKPITVKAKLKCQTCGRKNKSNHKFCYNCGTSLF